MPHVLSLSTFMSQTLITICTPDKAVVSGFGMDLTSPLTTLPSISTPESYFTAQGSPSNPSNRSNSHQSNAADETALSSPVDDHAPEKLSYRDAAQLPHELRSHCQIHLEEQLCVFRSRPPSPSPLHTAL